MEVSLVVFYFVIVNSHLAQATERIIDGDIVQGIKKPPFLSIFNFQPGSSVKCSSSIIASYWIVSAAHCIVSKKLITKGSCLDNYEKAKFQTLCEIQPNGDMKLIFPVQKEKTPEVYVGVDDLNYEHDDETKKFLVDFIISHRDGYQGGKYGAFGGYDILLLKTRNPMGEIFRACLPKPSFTFHDPLIGGYGRYRRIPCEVNDMGPNVYQFCKMDSKCMKKEENKKYLCGVNFKYKNKVHKKCIEDDTPSSQSPICQDFFDETNLTTADFLRRNVNEIAIFDQDLNSVLSKCYRSSPGRYGWCGITKNIISSKQNKKEDTIVAYDDGWGFCSESCGKSKNTAISGQARVKKVQILDQEFCDSNLKSTREGKTPFTVMPKVYCVAYNETFKTAFYKKVQNGLYEELDSKLEYHIKLGREHQWYTRSTGSCRGDSGGPLYVQVGDEYVLLGTTSRGTGKIANCGGVDNPTHYVRIKDMVPWLLNYIDEEDLCLKD